jgi:WXG100 family type VII secretion target
MTIEYSHPEFHASVADVRRTARSLESARARASGDVSALLDAWRGAAAAEFAEAWSSWLSASAAVASALSGLADAMEAFRDDLTTCDARAASTLDDLARRLS